jgi:hypothetical protein
VQFIRVGLGPKTKEGNCRFVGCGCGVNSDGGRDALSFSGDGSDETGAITDKMGQSKRSIQFSRLSRFVDSSGRTMEMSSAK